MIELETVRSWIEEEGYETEPRDPEDDELEWQLRVTYPRGSDYFIDVAHFRGRETLVVFSQHQFSGVEAQENVTEWELINFRLGVRESLLSQPIRFHFAPAEFNEPIEYAGFERPLYDGDLTKPRVMEALESIHRGLAVVSNRLQMLQLRPAAQQFQQEEQEEQ